MYNLCIVRGVYVTGNIPLFTIVEKIYHGFERHCLQNISRTSVTCCVMNSYISHFPKYLMIIVLGLIEPCTWSHRTTSNFVNSLHWMAGSCSQFHNCEIHSPLKFNIHNLLKEYFLRPLSCVVSVVEFTSCQLFIQVFIDYFTRLGIHAPLIR